METKIKAIIVEDEELSRTLITSYLKDFGEIEIIKECANGFEGIKAISELKPHLVFLDIQMPKLNGFEMLELLDTIPEIIFITAHNEFAIKAFELNAVDYLLKPYSKERLVEAVQKAVSRIKSPRPADKNIEKLISQSHGDIIERVVVKTGSKIKVIPVQKMHYLEAQDDYVMIYTEDSKHLKQATMNFFETHLDPKQFIRVHRSYIVKIDQVVQLEPYEKDNYVAILKSGAKIKVSKSGMKNLRTMLNF
jgi:two-component system LytT family response regulator